VAHLPSLNYNLNQKQIKQKQEKDAINFLKANLQYICIVLITGLNLGLSLFVRYYQIPFVPNSNPIGFNFGLVGSILLTLIVTFISYEAKLAEKSVTGFIFTLGGIYSNFSEKIIFGSVADYMSFLQINFNLADIQILLALLLLNYQVWFGKK